ncbi:thiamine-monophosphate kinase [Tersicoccus solisilvae]|uniref:Thiamine-monophosphate kinase n=1 Tax=Tersicoccus solisilvae TaxID=1882339 RepID=A0ABQ1PD85_9MICC|nr:thiamine-phosphate kinase [Tersicoccus solisilvae]GGC94887.1 thiamine-monophosphate kinase [Tersicoccus solisilvae]
MTSSGAPAPSDPPPGLGDQGDPATRVGALSEAQLLAAFLPRLPQAAPEHGHDVGNGDDAAVLRIGDERVVVTVDTLVQDLDYRAVWPNGRVTLGHDVGFKGVAQNLSDLNAMAAHPVGLLVSLAMPPGTPVDWVLSLADGIADAVRALGAQGCTVAGGDLSGAREVVLTITALGRLDEAGPVLRSGARPGDEIAVTGRVGEAAAGLALLDAAVPAGTAQGTTGRERALVEELVLAQLRPRPPLGAGAVAARAGAHALMDVSDGLVRDGERLARASGVRVDLDTARLAPFADRLAPAAALLGADPLRWCLTGGEDFGLLAAFPPGTVPPGFTAIGSVADGPAELLVDGRPSPTTGWDHFAA